VIHARHYLFIPGYTGPSLSREPEDDEESEMRKVALKRFQLLSKCVDYKMATIYMQSSDWDIESVKPPPNPPKTLSQDVLGQKLIRGKALQKYQDDLEWEKANPRRDPRKLKYISRR
jgi:hypothetical protein